MSCALKVHQVNQNSAEETKSILASTTNLTNEATQVGKLYSASKDITGKQILVTNVERLESHRQNFMDMLYVHIQEHSQKL